MKEEIKILINEIGSDSMKLKEHLLLLFEEINNIFLALKSLDHIGEAKKYFQDLEKTQILLYDLINIKNINVPNQLRFFVRDFERIDNLDSQLFFFNLIQKNEYSLTEDYRDRLTRS